MPSAEQFEIRPVSQGEADQIPWLNNRKRERPERVDPLEILVDQVLAEINASETGVACIDLGKLGKLESQSVFSLPGRLRIIASKRGEELQTRLIREGVVHLEGGRHSYANAEYTRMYIRRSPDEK